VVGPEWLEHSTYGLRVRIFRQKWIFLDCLKNHKALINMKI